MFPVNDLKVELKMHFDSLNNLKMDLMFGDLIDGWLVDGGRQLKESPHHLVHLIQHRYRSSLVSFNLALIWVFLFFVNQ